MPELLDTLISRNLWLSSIGNAIGLTMHKVRYVILGMWEPDDAVRHNLSQVLGGDWSGDISSKNPQIPYKLMREDVALTAPGVELPKGAAVNIAVKAWLEQVQIFSLDVLVNELHAHGYKRASQRNLGRILNRFGYHSKREYVQALGRQISVWRFNPYRFGLNTAHERRREGVTTYDDVSEKMPEYTRSKSWQLNLIHFAADHPKFTLAAIARAIGVDNLSALRRQLRLRGYHQVAGAWQAKDPSERKKPARRERVEPTGYVLTKRDERGEVVLLPGNRYEIVELALVGTVRPKVFRSVARALAAHPGHEAKKWTRVHTNVNDSTQFRVEPTGL